MKQTGARDAGSFVTAARMSSAVSRTSSDTGVAARTGIGLPTRVTLAGAGAVSWAAGGVATFIGKGNAGATALIILGAASLLVALMGRWPSRIAVSGNEVSWDAVKDTVESQIEAAESVETDGGGKRQLEDLLIRLITLRQTGVAPPPAAELYDRGVVAAVQRLIPGADVVALRVKDKEIPDFVVRHGGSEFYLETKWRENQDADFRGRTLPSMLDWVAGKGKLLVVVNAAAGHVTDQARSRVSERLGRDGQVVGWLDARDDTALAQALKTLLNDTRENLGKENLCRKCSLNWFGQDLGNPPCPSSGALLRLGAPLGSQAS